MSSLGTVARLAEGVQLSGDQQRALEAVTARVQAGTGGVLFCTGKAGTGKSTALGILRQRHCCVVLASTGLAAVNVGGMTIHRFFGFPTGPMTRGRTRALDGEKLAILERADVIVIDEASMVRCDLLDAIDAALQKTLASKQPFGGKTILLVGDLSQLEPVVESDNEQVMALMGKYASPFFFDARVFKGSKQKSLDLDAEKQIEIQQLKLAQIFRQTDEEFTAALNLIRVGDPSGLYYFNKHAAGRQPTPGAVILTFTNGRADMINGRRIEALDTEPRIYKARMSGEFERKEYPVPYELTFKIGAQVMVCRNGMADDGYPVANGSVGEVAYFSPNGWPVVELRDGRLYTAAPTCWEKKGYTYNAEDDEIEEDVVGEFSQVPLKLAWAVTTHKAQGQTLDAAHLELERPAFAHGQLYVALSRVRSIAGLTMGRRLTEYDLIVNARVREYCGEDVPVSRFNAEAIA